MTTPTHIITGLVIGKALYEISVDPVGITLTTAMLIGVLASNLPDINMLWHRQIATHHKDLTHYPSMVLVFILAIYISIFLFKWPLIVAHIIAVGLGIHIFLDLFGSTIGVHLLWPISNKEFSFTKLDKETKIDSLWKRIMIGKNVYPLEAVIWVGCLVYLLA